MNLQIMSFYFLLILCIVLHEFEFSTWCKGSVEPDPILPLSPELYDIRDFIELCSNCKETSHCIRDFLL